MEASECQDLKLDLTLHLSLIVGSLSKPKLSMQDVILLAYETLELSLPQADMGLVNYVISFFYPRKEEPDEFLRSTKILVNFLKTFPCLNVSTEKK